MSPFVKTVELCPIILGIFCTARRGNFPRGASEACSERGACSLRQGGHCLGERSIEQVAAHRFPAVFPVL